MTHAPHQRSLQALILDKKGDRSYERVSRDCGGTPTRNALQKLATSKTRAFPDRDTLLGLQRGLPATMPELLSACAISMELLDDASAPGTLVLRGAGALPSSAQQLLVDLSYEMQRLAREGDGSATERAAPISRAGESPAADPERRKRSADGASSIQELPVTHDGQPDEDELARRRRERQASAAASEEDDALPMPEELMAGYDEPQESIRARERQDEDAEGPQAGPEDEN